MSTTSSYPRRVLNSCKGVDRLLVCAVAFGFVGGTMAQAQLPYMNAGPDSAFAQIDFAQIYLDTGNRQMKKNAEQQEQRKHLVDSGAVSALDLDAPGKAIDEFNTASTLLKAQKSKEAIAHLQKAIAAYPKFVIAHNTLGLAYLDQEDGRAKDEFEAAAKLDEKFPGSFLNLGLLALSAKDFGTRLFPSGESGFPQKPRIRRSFRRWRLPKMETINTSRPWRQPTGCMLSTTVEWPTCTTSPPPRPCHSAISIRSRPS